MDTVQLVIDIIALIVFSIEAILGMTISPWFVVVWILIAMGDHIRREE